MPGIEAVMANPPSLKWPRLRSLFIFKGENPTEASQIRIMAWCMPDLHNLCCDANIERSHAASRLALPHLLTEINAVKKPEEAEQRFMSMASNPADSFLAIRGRGGENGEPLCTLSTNVGNGASVGPEFSDVYIA